MIIDFGTILEFGKYKGHKVDKHPEGTVSFGYLTYLRDKTDVQLSERLLTALRGQENRTKAIKYKTSADDTKDFSPEWEPNVCSLCGQRHVMSCGYY